MTSGSDYVETQGPLLDEGVPVEAELVGFGDPYPDKFNPDKEKMAWRFIVESDEYDEPVEAAAFVTISTFESDTMQSNMVKFARALNGGELPLDEDGLFDDELLIGKRALIVPKTYAKGEIEKNKAVSVLPLKKTKKVAAAV